MKSRLSSLVIALALSSACAVRVASPPRPPPPPPPSFMGSDEAVRRGDEFCRAHGWSCRLENVNQRGDAWLLNFDAASPAARGRLHLEFDGYSRGLLRADEPHAPPPPAPLPPPPPVARPMNSDEAIRLGNDYCRARGYGCRLIDVDLRGGVWNVNFDAQAPFARGRLHLEFDSVHHNLIRAQDPRPPAPPRSRAMNSDEATRHGLEFCRARHYDCRMKDADFAGGRVWKLNYDVVGQPHGRLHLEFDAFSRALIEVNEDLRSF